MVLTYKYRLKDKHSKAILRKYSYAVNQVWNFCVATQKKTQQNWKFGRNNKWLGKYDFQKLTKETSKELQLHAQTIKSTCNQFVQSRDQHKVVPKFRKSAGPKRNLGWIPFQEQSRQITPDSVTYLGRTYRFFGSKRRPLPTNTTGGCFVEDSLGRWWVCFYVDVPVVKSNGKNVIGIDLGLKTLATLSNGEKIDNITPYRKYEAKLKVAQKANNKKQIKRIHNKIKNIRRDYLHKTTTKLIKENKSIFIGNVSSSKLAKTKMAKSVLDAAWGMFRNMLSYKSSRNSVYYREVDERFSTQICSSCGIIPPESPKGITGLGMRVWECSNCNTIHDRDRNSAKNILKFGLNLQPPVEGSPKSLYVRFRR
jgi:putative transposase